MGEQLFDEYEDSENNTFDLASLQIKYCPAVPPTPTPMPPTPTPMPTATLLAKILPVQVVAPFLTEKITSCDYEAGFINFELADSARSLDALQVLVAFNDSETVCNVPETNTEILTCHLPASSHFPLHVQVQVDNVEVNDFSFNGFYCNYTAPSGSGNNDNEDEGGSDSGVPACDPHIEPSCPVDCLNPANADLCE
ncbi:hypothetical protein MASR2M66_28910 [Chloroflexota bacterium]